MTPKEYFRDWTRVIDYNEFINVNEWLKKQNPKTLCPRINDVYKAFTLCSLRDCKCVFIGLDPYSTLYKGRPMATGVAFGNVKEIPEDNISPSLQVIKEACIDYTVPHQEVVFDNTLESWGRQGILLLNSALTCEVNRPCSHSLQWRQFTLKLIQNLQSNKTGLTYVLFGVAAIMGFKDYIDKSNNTVIKSEHPAYCARIGKKMSGELFREINKSIKANYDTEIEWYQEYKPI